ncbi:MAG: hypothetical protein JW953_16080 [Anaerolineae bacterium]|nr:hypothetical protein [Anaerolineae bacterium]
MKSKLLRLSFFLVFLLWPGFFNVAPAQAGDPDDTIGPPNQNHLVCIDKNSLLIVDLDSDAFEGSETIGFFDPEIEVDVKQLEKDCEAAEDFERLFDPSADFTVDYFRQTRIEGHVFEFHPDPNGPGGWTAVRSRDVPVVASGPGFEIFWGSEKDGFYFFNNLGEGPVTLNLRLPPDAYPINPNITVMSRGFAETWPNIDLGFYRGDVPPDDVEELRLPGDHPISTLIPGDTILDTDEYGNILGMPNVGGALSPDRPAVIIILAAVMLVILPAAGILKIRRNRPET